MAHVIFSEHNTPTMAQNKSRFTVRKLYKSDEVAPIESTTSFGSSACGLNTADPGKGEYDGQCVSAVRCQ